MKLLRFFLSMLMLATALLVTNNTFAADCRYRAYQVTASALNVRQWANGPKIGTIYRNQIYIRAGKDTSSSWLKIWYDHRPGWVHKSYIRRLDNWRTCKQATNEHSPYDVTVRSGPGSGYRYIGKAKYGSMWYIAGSSKGWNKIYYKGGTRWVPGWQLKEPWDYWANNDFWNRWPNKEVNNCYAYATNRALNHGRYWPHNVNKWAQPGVSAGYGDLTGHPDGSYCSRVEARLRADGLYQKSRNINYPPNCPRQQYPMALFIGTGQSSFDVSQGYHVYRYDKTRRFWSGKDGIKPVTNRDASGNIMWNLARANHNYWNSGGLNYDNFCSYFCVDPTAINVDRW